MKLYEKILSAEFEEVKLGFVSGKTGYLAKEVDSHLQAMALEVEKIEKENSKLSRQNEMLETAKKNAGDVKLDKVMSMEDVAEKEAELAEQAQEIKEMKESFERVLVVAQHEASIIKENARKEAEQLYNEAQKDARLIVEKAREMEREKEAEIAEKIEAARQEVFSMAERYDEIKRKLNSVYESIGAEVVRIQNEDVQEDQQQVG